MLRNTAGKGSLVMQFLTLMFIAWLIPAICLADDWTITAEGYGPVHAGMSIRQAEKLLNTPLQASENAKLNPRCDFVYQKHGHDGVSFMVQAGAITHVEIEARGIFTDAGIQVGDPVSKLAKVYGKNLEKVAATDGYVYFVWRKRKDGMYGIKYKTDEGPGEGRVEAIFSGSPTIQLTEGCS